MMVMMAVVARPLSNCGPKSANTVLSHTTASQPVGGRNAREVDLTQRGCNGIAHHDAQQDRHDLDHAAAPNIADDDDGHSDNGNKPIGLAVGDSRACQDQADGNDDGTGHHRRKEAHDALGTKRTEQRCQHRIEQAGAGNAQQA